MLYNISDILNITTIRIKLLKKKMLVKIRFRKANKGKNKNLGIYQIVDLNDKIILDDIYSLQDERIQQLKQTEIPGTYERK